MATLPKPLHSVVAEMYRWRERTTNDDLRPHLGCSIIGHDCARYLWQTFRWIAKPKFDGRMLRLFNRGQREEPVIDEELIGIGAEVSSGPAPGEQWRVSACGGHVGGSLDSVVRGLPGGSATQWELLEDKTHNAKSFKDLVAKGVKESKPQHWAQVLLYLKLTGMTRANYIAVNKDTDDLYHERVHADDDAAQTLLERAERVVFAAEPPLRLSDDPSWYGCKWCHFHASCHGDAAPLPTCRSCVHATPDRDGTWQCERHGRTLTVGDQKLACADHRVIPVLLERWATQTDASADENWVQYQIKTGTHAGRSFVNGPAPAGHSSAEIHAAADKRMLVEPGVQQYRETFGGRITA